MKRNFFKALSEGLKIGAINTIEDIENIHKGMEISEDKSYRYRLVRWLREYLVLLFSEDVVKFIEDEIENKILVEWKQKLTDFIQKIEETSPYSDLPEPERTILTDISNYLKDNNKDAVKRKLSELSVIIQARNDDLNRIKNTNKWAVPLTIAGMILTIIFGLLSIFK